MTDAENAGAAAVAEILIDALDRIRDAITMLEEKNQCRVGTFELDVIRVLRGEVK